MDNAPHEIEYYDTWLAYAAERLASGVWQVSGVHAERLGRLVAAEKIRYEREKRESSARVKALAEAKLACMPRHEGDP